jgi:hypothetical protein
LSYIVNLKANVFESGLTYQAPTALPDTSTGVLRDDEVDDSEHPGSNIPVNLNCLMFIIGTVDFT